MKAPATQLNTRNSGNRLTFLDWTRGAAVVSMLQGHVFHSFVRQDLRTDGPYVVSQLFGGIGPAIFLVLTGITLAFLMDKRERDGLPPRQRWLAALRRAGYLFMIAMLFRLQLWLFAAGQSPWTDLLKVDVLNLMGFAIALMSILAVFTTADRVRMGAGLGVAIAAASPLISAVNWSWLPPQLSNYIVPSYNYFAFFPWAAFIAFGISIGSVLRLTSAEQMNRLMQWAALGGFALVLGGEYFSNLPYAVYPKSEYWLNSPGLIVSKLGVVMLVLSVAFLWTEYGLGNSWSWVRQLGTTSLLVYWVHVELVYGRWFGFWKDNLNNIECAIAAVSVVVLMVLLSVARTHWRKFPFPAFIVGSFPVHAPRRVSGD